MTRALSLSPWPEFGPCKTSVPAGGQGLDGQVCPSWAADFEESLLQSSRIACHSYAIAAD